MLGLFKSTRTKSPPSPPSDGSAEHVVGIALTSDVPSEVVAPSSPFPESACMSIADPTSRLSTSTVTAMSAPTMSVAPISEPSVPQTPVEPIVVLLPESPNPCASLAPPSPVHVPGAVPPFPPSEPSSPSGAEHTQSQSQPSQPYLRAGEKDGRRFSFLSLPFLRSDTKLVNQPRKTASTRGPSHAMSEGRFRGRKSRSTKPFGFRSLRIGGTDKRARECARMVQSLIVGGHDLLPNAKPTKGKVPIVPAMVQVKAQLLKPKSARKVIAQLRALPPHPTDVTSNPAIPMRAVCLDMADAEAYERYFSKLGSVCSASLSSLALALKDIHVVDLLLAPNAVAGVAATAECLLAGGGPTAGIILEDFQQITPQLLALGYATGKAIMPDHKGVIVPTDRISVLTYWWGFEICLPPTTLVYIQSAASPSSALLDLLTALSVLVEGVREILPFIRYLAQFVQMEWHSIQAADRGKGVVCCATWLLPAALVPRAWDFSDPPEPSEPEVHVSSPPAVLTPLPATVTVRLSSAAPPPKVSTDITPRVSSAISEMTCADDETRPAISSEPPVLPELVVSSPRSVEGEDVSADGDVYTMRDERHHEGEAIVL